MPLPLAIVLMLVCLIGFVVAARRQARLGREVRAGASRPGRGAMQALSILCLAGFLAFGFVAFVAWSQTQHWLVW